jgi:phosphatidylglycerol:prolipoprotein diacylglycerol transferase
MFTSPGAIFHIGSLPLHYYGIIMGAAILTGIMAIYKITQKFYTEINADIIFDIAPIVIIGAILGARIYYCTICWSYYSWHLIEIPQIWLGGMSIHGGLLGGLICGIIYAKKYNLPILKLCDIFAYGLCLGQAIGRWGNFFNSEAFGAPTNCFLKLYIPIWARPVKYMQYSYFHPTFLYESVCDILIFIVLFFGLRLLLKKFNYSKDGIIFFSYLILYSFVRILIEQVRIDSVLDIAGIPIAQIVSAITIIISIAGIYLITKSSKNQNDKDSL